MARPVSKGVLDFDAYLDRLASAAPTPGGGSAATLVGALSAALVAMVARITLGSQKLASVHPEAIALASDADVLRSAFLAARPLDEAAYEAVVTAQALPRSNDTEKATRTARVQAALNAAAEAPLETAALAEMALALCERAAQLRNTYLMSDVDCAVRFARAALEADAANVHVNHRYLKDAQVVAAQSRRLAAILERAHDHENRTLAIVTAG